MHSLSVSDVQYSCFLCCTKFLFSMLYKIPVFNDVQYSCMKCCTLVCFALICCIKVWLYVILVGVLYLILLYTSIATLSKVATQGAKEVQHFHAVAIFLAQQVVSLFSPLRRSKQSLTWVFTIYHSHCCRVCETTQHRTSREGGMFSHLFSWYPPPRPPPICNFSP